MTGDLITVAEDAPRNRKVNTGNFIEFIASNLQRKL